MTARGPRRARAALAPHLTPARREKRRRPPYERGSTIDRRRARRGIDGNGRPGHTACLGPQQAALPSMGFGGVGASGMGRHHGEEGFRELSNPRGYFERGPGGVGSWLYPPYGAGTRKLIEEVALAPLAKKLKFAVPQAVKNLFATRLWVGAVSAR